jgi:hypothetical protein
MEIKVLNRQKTIMESISSLGTPENSLAQLWDHIQSTFGYFMNSYENIKCVLLASSLRYPGYIKLRTACDLMMFLKLNQLPKIEIPYSAHPKNC